MIRLYPRVLQAEQNIQDLRRRVKDAEKERLNKDGRIVTADQQIEELTLHLDTAVRDQQSLLQELGELDRSGIELRESLAEVRQEGSELRGQLARTSREANDRGAQLRQAEETIVEQQSRLCEAEREIRERLAQLAQAERRRLEVHAVLEISYSEQNDLRLELGDVRHEGRELQEQLISAAERSGEQKAEMTQDAQEISELTRQLASERLLVRDFEVEDEQHATVREARRELRDELKDSYSEAELLQHEVVSLQRRIPILEEARLAAEHAQRVAEQARRLADQDLEGLRLEVYQAKEEAKYAWEARESAAAEALAQHLDLASSNKHTQDLRNALEAEREQSALLQQELEDRLENARRAERETTQRFLTAQDDLEKSHEACRIIASERLATVTALEDQVTNLTDQLAQSQRSGEDLQERIKALTRDKDELTDEFNEEKAAMEKEISILKNKRQCTVS